MAMGQHINNVHFRKGLRARLKIQGLPTWSSLVTRKMMAYMETSIIVIHIGNVIVEWPCFMRVPEDLFIIQKLNLVTFQEDHYGFVQIMNKIKCNR